jgi:hypothetical protein
MGMMLAFALAAATAEQIPRRLSAAEKAQIATLVQAELKDPESARFRWPRLRDPSGLSYCGWVNAKNALGGYVGFRPYKVAASILDLPAFAPTSVTLEPRLGCEAYKMGSPPAADE